MQTSDSLALTTGWSRDDRDNLLVPTRGRYQRAFSEVGLPGLDLQYYRLTYQFQQYFALFPRVTLAFNGEIGYGDGYSGDPYPFFKNYYVGGIGSVRGFESGSLGPRDIDDSPLGRQPAHQLLGRGVRADTWRRSHAARADICRCRPGLGTAAQA